MFEALFGNPTIEKILIFLFVNGKCYGKQLERHLKIPLTPIQKACHRLETGGVILSHYAGKTRIFQFNPTFPLLPELEQLLKKIYTLLPSIEKKSFYVLKDDFEGSSKQTENKHKSILKFWDQLSRVEKLTFEAKTKPGETHSWIRKGQADVFVSKENGSTLIFTEKGHWHGKEGEEMNFSNVFRWTLDRTANLISLEHLRRGPDQPVFLLHLAPTRPHTLSSVDSHLCENDIYFGQISFDRHSLRFHWRVIGPKKNEEIDYYYHSS